ncbi:MAG: pyruvate formate lyase family protein [Desulfosudis oleivorans]|nr:pyruvate formate lyase family protein [Desulfosudis oleivorans]
MISSTPSPSSSPSSSTSPSSTTTCWPRLTSSFARRRFSHRSSTAASTKGRDVTKGGAVYNSSGTAIIGLADVTDSLMVIKKLVFDEKKITFAELKKAVDTNFENDPALLCPGEQEGAAFRLRQR